MASTARLFLKLVDAKSKMVQGEAEPENFKDQIEVDDWSWSIAASEVKEGAPKRVEPSVVGLSKGLDRASARLMSALYNGEVFPTAVLSLVEEMEETAANFDLSVVLTQVRVIDYTLNGRDEEKSLSLDESLTLNYATIDFKYDNGSHQVSIRRPPDASEAGAKKPIDEITEDVKEKLKPPERKELKRRIDMMD